MPFEWVHDRLMSGLTLNDLLHQEWVAQLLSKCAGDQKDVWTREAIGWRQVINLREAGY